MYVKNNPVISKMYAHSGLTLNEEGLFYCHPTEGRLYFLITTDHVRIAEIMGFDFAELEAAKDYTAFFDLLPKNKFFRPSRFASDTSEGQCRMFKELADILGATPVYKGYTTRQIPDMYEPLAEFDFERRHKRLLELSAKSVQLLKKFNGGAMLKYFPDFPKPKLQEVFAHFGAKHAGDLLARLEYLDTHTEEEIATEYYHLFQ